VELGPERAWKLTGSDRYPPPFCHSDRSRTLSEVEGDGGVEEPAFSRQRHEPCGNSRLGCSEERSDARVGRTLLSDVFDLDFDFDLDVDFDFDLRLSS
jgi:hypothetical protein